MAVAHLAFEFGARHQGGDRIDDQDIDRSRADKRVCYFQRLLSSIGLGNQQIIDINTELAGIGRVERMLGVDKSTGPATSLRLGNDMKCQGRLTRALRSIDLYDPATRQAADAERYVEAQGPRRDHLGIRGGLARPELHYRTLAEGTFDLSERCLQSPLFIHRFLV